MAKMMSERLLDDENLVKGLQQFDGEAWGEFSKEKRGWKNLATFLRKKGYFRKDEGRIEDVVQITLKKVADYVASGRFVCPQEDGQRFFWAFVRTVAVNAAQDFLRKENRRGMQTDMEEDFVGEADSLLSHDHWKAECSMAELDAQKRMQFYVLHQALALVLADKKVPVDRRRVLYALMVVGMTPGEIRKLDAFKTKGEAAFYKYVKDSKDVLRKKALQMWRMAMPNGGTMSDLEALKSWQELASDLARSNEFMANASC